MKVAATINGADLLLLIPTTSNVLLLADIIGFFLGAAVVAWEWSQRERRLNGVTESSTVIR